MRQASKMLQSLSFNLVPIRQALPVALARLATGDRTPAAKAREFRGELALPGVEGQLDGLSRLARMLCPSNKPLIILVDQFEETWTLCRPPIRRTRLQRNGRLKNAQHSSGR